jgi:hypothetical protein
MKGRVACEISSGDELLLTEMIFNGVFNPLSPEQCAALLSCFVFTEKVSFIPSTSAIYYLTYLFQSEQAVKLTEELAAPLRVLQEIARRIAKVSKESKLPIVEDDYVQSFKVELMDAVIQWCRGAGFAEICKARLLLRITFILNLLTFKPPFTSFLTNSKGVLSVSSEDYWSLFDKCRWPLVRSGTPSWKRGLPSRPKCLRVKIRSSSVRRCIYNFAVVLHRILVVVIFGCNSL